MIAQVGAYTLGKHRAKFCLWAPTVEHVSLRLVSPHSRMEPLKKDDQGYWETQIDDVPPGTLYFFHLDGRNVPDPASFFQPQGIGGPSCLIDHQAFAWRHPHWQPQPLEEMIIYELHIG